MHCHPTVFPGSVINLTASNSYRGFSQPRFTLLYGMPEICLIQTSVSSAEDAERIASGLLDAHLAACVHISAKGVSLYRWNGDIARAEEQLLVIKTTADLADQVICWMQTHHPYTLPELIRARWEASAAYAQWVEENCAGADDA